MMLLKLTSAHVCFSPHAISNCNIASVHAASCLRNSLVGLSVSYGGVEGPPHIFFDIMLSHTDDIVTRP